MMTFEMLPINSSDEEFLFSLYASTRADEMSLVPWTDDQKNAFIRFQFQAQTEHYLAEYPSDSFKIIKRDGKKIGRLYICELKDEVRIIDLTLSPEFRGHGFGSAIVSDILRTAEKPVRIYLENFNRSIGLFERLGFRVISDEGIYQLWENSTVGARGFNAGA